MPSSTRRCRRAGFLSTSVIAANAEAMAQVVALAFFIPVLTGSGGNTGSQSATLIIRALATGDLSAARWLRVLGKETLVGSLLGLTLGAFIAGSLWNFAGWIGGFHPYDFWPGLIK